MMLEQWRMEHDPESLKEELKRRVKAAQEECWYATALFGETFPFLNRLKDEGFTLHVATGDYAQLKKGRDRATGRPRILRTGLRRERSRRREGQAGLF